MESTWWALLLKPFIGIAILAAMFFLPRYLARWLYPLIPKRWRAALFEGWEHGSLGGSGARDASDATRPDERLLK